MVSVCNCDRIRRLWKAATMVSVIMTALALRTFPATAAPPGRAWAPIDVLRLQGYSWLAPFRLDREEDGRPFVFATAEGPATQSAGFRWMGDHWQVAWRLGYSTSFSNPVLAPPGTYHLLYRTITTFGPNGDRCYLITTQVAGDVVAPPDTVAEIYAYANFYREAVTARRRWVVVEDFMPPSRFRLRLFYSDTARSWREVSVSPSSGVGADCAVAALGDTTALVVWSGLGVKWATLRGSTWTEGTQPLPLGILSSTLKFRPRPSGGYWLGTDSGHEWVTLLGFKDGVWSGPDSLRCAYRAGPAAHYSDSVDLSIDPGEYPAAAWSAQNGNTGVETVCVSIPSDSGFGMADDVSGGDDGMMPVVTRDLNGDVWVAWWKYFDGMFWSHSYTAATTSAPRVTGTGQSRTVAWRLSEPAPETWWAVLRSRPRRDAEPQSVGSGSVVDVEPNGGGGTPPVDGQEFDLAARVRAGADTEMRWTDTTRPRGPLSYKIRRECLDKRFEWLSPEVRWAGKSERDLSLGRVASPASSLVALEVENAVRGTLVLRLYDIQGRLVIQQAAAVGGGERSTTQLDLTAAAPRLRDGIYFLRATDAAGKTSEAIKIVALR